MTLPQQVDPAAGESPPRTPEGLFSPRFRAASTGFAAIMLLTGFAALALVTSMPAAVRDLHGVALYPLAVGGFVTTGLFGGVLSGELGDRRGPRPPLLVGLGLSVAALLLCGAAGSIGILVAGRCLDGLAGGLVAVAVNVAVGHSYPPELRPRAMSLMSACWIGPSLAGPPIAGLVTSALSWRWVFYGLAVLTALSALACARALGRPEQGAEGAQPLRRKDGPLPRRLLGDAAAVAAGAGLLQYASSGLDPVRLGCAVGGLALLVPTVPRLLPRGTLRAARGLPAVVLLSAACSGVYFALESFSPLILIELRHTSVALAGATFTCATVSWVLASWLQGHTWASVPRARLAAVGTALLVAAAALGVAGTRPGSPAPTAGAALVVAGFGMGLAVPSLSTLLLDLSAVERQGYWSAAARTAQSLGQILVLGAAGALFDLGDRGRPEPSAFTAALVMVLIVSVPGCLLALRKRSLVGAVGAVETVEGE